MPSRSEDRYFPHPDNLTYFFKGRVALWAILRGLGIGEGDEVIVPAYTCVAVPNAVLYTGATPIYADIDPECYTLTAASVSKCLTEHTRAIIAQSTYGLAPDLDPILEVGRESDALVIEDCAQGLGGRYKGVLNGLTGDAAFFSTQWSKPVSTGLGGLAYTEDECLAPSLRNLEGRLASPSWLKVLGLALQLIARPLERNRFVHYFATSAYRRLTQDWGLIEGSSSGGELRTDRRPADYAERMSWLQKALWRRRLDGLQRTVRSRRAVADRYDDFFEQTDVDAPSRPDYAFHGMLRYPIRVEDKPGFLARCRDLSIPAGDWFVSPVHPVTESWERWGYRRGECPVAERACSEVVNLFTDDKALSHDQLQRALGPQL